jgi:hypothetical protein
MIAPGPLPEPTDVDDFLLAAFDDIEPLRRRSHMYPCDLDAVLGRLGCVMQPTVVIARYYQKADGRWVAAVTVPSTDGRQRRRLALSDWRSIGAR